METPREGKRAYEVERSARHAERPGFRINELEISPRQKVPWHTHTNVQDTFYVLQGRIRVSLRDPEEEVRLAPGESHTVRPGRPHLVTNVGDGSAIFLVLQGFGEYDFVPAPDALPAGSDRGQGDPAQVRGERRLDILPLLDELQTIARNGLNHATNPYDRERYERLLALASTHYATALGVAPAEVRGRLLSELGYITPKVGAEAAVFDAEGRILLVRRSDDGRWCLPCGWVEPNETPAEAAVREAREETGLEVRALRLVDVFARKPGMGFGPHSAVAVLYLCEVIGGEPRASHEVTEAAYRRIEDVADWHELHQEYATAARAAWQAGRGEGERSVTNDRWGAVRDRGGLQGNSATADLLEERTIPMDWEGRYAGRMGRVQTSPIMALIRVMAERPLINFASGLPDPAAFPVKALREAAEAVLEEDWRAGLQYGEAEGFRPLRQWVAEDLTRRGAPAGADQLLIVNGSQQGIDLVARAFLQPGDVVLTEEPTYLAALQVFASCEADVRPLRSDGDGLDPDAVVAGLRTPRVKLLYVMPNHQNPSGVTLAPDRRRPLLLAAARAGVPVLADEAYLDLRYDPGEPAPLAAADPGAPVLTVGTFSKTIAPGLRVAWIAGPAAVIGRLALLKQTTDLHTGSFAQRLVHRYAAAGHLPAQVSHLRAAYREKRDQFLQSLERRLGRRAGWTRPAGGMFLLLRLGRGESAGALLPRALDSGVAYVPGAPFFPGGGGEETMRLNFVSPPLADIDEGVARLAKALGR